jgi:glycosyltransferase involved in cell wall biosynthesis
MRILVLAHGHPDLSTGGGERAAYSLFERLKQSPGITKAVFVAADHSGAIGHDAAFGSFRGRADEILVATPPVDGFTFQSVGYDALKRLVTDLIHAVKPDLVHIHHFIFWGAEVIELFRQAGVRVVFTLHEYAAICAHFGQMVKADGQLCYVSSPGECGQCFPSTGAGKFFVRTTVLKALLDQVDHFVAPSEFLKQRYVSWGLPPERITVIENLLDASVVAQSQTLLSEGGSSHRREGKWVFGYFAQINPFKGYDVLLEAVSLLPASVRRQVIVRIHGENRHYLNTAFHQRTQTLIQDVKDVVSLMGSYRRDEVIGLMAACDWIVVPSIWWENSPIVIQEARIAARPLIGAKIGGIAEKMNPETDSFFPARSPGALANVISDIVEGGRRPKTKHLIKLAQTRIAADEIYVSRHRALYDQVLAR